MQILVILIVGFLTSFFFFPTKMTLIKQIIEGARKMRVDIAKEDVFSFTQSVVGNISNIQSR